MICGAFVDLFYEEVRTALFPIKYPKIPCPYTNYPKGVGAGRIHSVDNIIAPFFLAIDVATGDEFPQRWE
jgi:hypothetical protein